MGTRLVTYLREIARRRQVSAEIDEELSFHLAQETQMGVARGLSPIEARRVALRDLGGLSQTREAMRATRTTWLDGVGRDVQYAVRSLVRAPRFTLVAVLTLGLGMGANTAVFSLLNSLYLRPLPVDAPDRLVYVTAPTRSGRPGHAMAEAVRERDGLFESVAEYSATQFNVSSTGEAEWVDGLWTSGSFLTTMGVRPFVGAMFSDAEDRPAGGGSGLVAILGHAFWARRFGAGNPVGQTLLVNHVPLTIVGVTPPEFFGAEVGRSFDVILPLGASAAVLPDMFPNAVGGELIARLRPGQTLAAANAALRAATPQLRATVAQRGEPRRASPGVGALAAVPAATGQSFLRGEYRQSLLTLMVVVALVLLIACANIANLLLARATARRHELSVRRAIGASTWRLARQALVESLTLSALGAAVGLLIALWASRLLVAQLAAGNALTAGQIEYGSARLFLDLSLDWRVLAFTFGAGAITALLFGIAPALRAAGVGPIDALKQGAGTLAANVGWRVSRLPVVGRLAVSDAVVIGQVVLSLLLVVAAGLFARSFASLSRSSLGYDIHRLLVVDLDTRRARTTPDTLIDVHARVEDAVRVLPGVTTAAVSLGAPPTGFGVHEHIEIAGAEARDPNATAQVVTPEWFRAMGMTLSAGRPLEAGDRRGTPRVAVVNQAFAGTFLGGGNAIGRTIVSFEHPIAIVGVVGDVVSGSPQEPASPAVYLPLAQAEGRLKEAVMLTVEEKGLSLVVRASRGSPMLLTRSIVAAIEGVDRHIGVTVRAPADQLRALLTRERVTALLSGFFAALALLLAGLGLYGVTAYAVSGRRREIGIRIALGANARGVVALVLGRVIGMVSGGIMLGMGLSLWASQFVASMLYGVEPRDGATLIGSSVALMTIGAVAAWLPARRASRIQPANVLRDE